LTTAAILIDGKDQLDGKDTKERSGRFRGESQCCNKNVIHKA